jgi:lysophospholipase L1-like esterase
MPPSSIDPRSAPEWGWIKIFSLTAALGAALAFLMGCRSGSTESPSSKDIWDTAFAVQGLSLRDDAILGRSIVEMGNNLRLAKFIRKCEAGSGMRIGFIGGSITEGTAASDAPHRYANQVCAFLSKAFVNAEFTPINAGIGSTNSRFGCSRAAVDLFAFKPDLIVLEYAVNDDQNDSVWFAETMEGLIRQSLSYSQDVPVILFQTMNKYGDSLNHRVQTRIARHYDIPVVGYRSAMWPLIAEGKLAWETLSRDDVHPNDAGHLVCGYLIYNFLKSGYASLESRQDAAIPMPAYLYSDLYEKAGIMGEGDSMLTANSHAGWSASADAKQRLSFASSTVGSKLTLQSRVREITLQYKFSQELHARLEIRIDGGPRDTLSNHFEQDWGGGYLRGQKLFQEDTARNHEIELTLLDEAPFDLRYVLFAP